jgi:hypothetical protein
MAMDQSHILWIATFAYASHIAEEFAFDWKGWATSVLELPVDWGFFAVANGVVIVFGVSCASVGWSLPGYALGLPALMLINATFFHFVPFIVKKRRFSPGLGTAILLFYPIGIWAYYGAWVDGVLTGPRIVISLLLGAALMATPIVMLRLRLRPYFRQDENL